jgi:hypothetical protein
VSGIALNRDQQRLLTIAAVCFAVLLMLQMVVVPLGNNDVWILMKVGELIVDNGRIPDTLLFPFTTVRDNHFNAHEWLVSVIYHECDRLLGLRDLMWVVGAFALVQFGLCVALARRLSGSLGVALVMAMMAMTCANARYVLRPELFALLLLVLLLMVLERWRAQRRWRTLAWTIPITLMWVNCHGSFLLAPVVVGLCALGQGLTAARAASGTTAQRLRAGWTAGLPLAVAVVAMTASCVVNPAGWRLLLFPFQLQHSVAIRALIKEWLPTFSSMFMAAPPFWIFVVVATAATAVVVRLRRHLEATDALLYLFFLAIALERSRHIVWFGFVALVVCARLVGRAGITPPRELRVRIGAALLAVAGLGVTLAFGNASHAHIYYTPSDNFSPGMVKELADPALSGNVLNSYELGGELIYRDWPRLKPSIDSRVDSYGDDYLLYHIRVLQDEKLLNLFLDGNHVNHMLLLRRDLDLGVRDMPSIRANWHIRLTDGDIFLIERNQLLPTTGTPQ